MWTVQVKLVKLLWSGEQVTNDWTSEVITLSGSTQVVELGASHHAFFLFQHEALHVVADSAYVVGIVQRIQTAFIKEVSKKRLFQLLNLAYLLKQPQHPHFIMHVRSHTRLLGPITQGNAVADKMTLSVVLPQQCEQAKLSHDFFHQNAHSLCKQFSLSLAQAKDIVRACPGCQRLAPLPLLQGVNSRGLKANKIWQMDITQIPSFGRHKYVHVLIDTFSGFLVATAHTGEKAEDVIKHLLHCFATTGVPVQLTTDSGPAYSSHWLESFLQTWGVMHLTGIPHSPTGQAIVEHAHGILKAMLDKQKRGNTPGVSPQEQLDKATYVLNVLNLSGSQNSTAKDRHFSPKSVPETYPKGF